MSLVKQASANKAPVVRLADRYAIPFTAASLLIAGVAWALSGDPVRFAEVLVLATPCPLLLAAPVALMGGMSGAARHGIVVKGGGVLEQLARVRAAVFDKTGTLTHGAPEIVKMVAFPHSMRQRCSRWSPPQNSPLHMCLPPRSSRPRSSEDSRSKT